MRLRAKPSELGAAEQDVAPGAAAEQDASVASEAAESAVAGIKRELAAVLLVGLAAIPLVSFWLDGMRELVVLGGYGLGAAIWVRVRAHGLLLAARGQRARAARDRHGP
jgi:hypothetical protein